jgi:N-acetylglutamate synthase-like GNAT family acetyltransferase
MRESTAVDLPAIRSLLTQAGLPTADLDLSPSLHLWVAEDGGALVGVIGLEQFRRAGLLRSLVVAPITEIAAWGVGWLTPLKDRRKLPTLSNSRCLQKRSIGSLRPKPWDIGS